MISTLPTTGGRSLITPFAIQSEPSIFFGDDLRSWLGLNGLSHRPSLPKVNIEDLRISFIKLQGVLTQDCQFLFKKLSRYSRVGITTRDRDWKSVYGPLS